MVDKSWQKELKDKSGSREEALEYALALHDAIGITPSIIKSGRGAHTYIVLDKDDYSINEIKTVSERLKALALKSGYKIDTSVASDMARVLRLPGTKHIKNRKALSVKLLREGTEVSLADLVASISKAERVFGVVNCEGSKSTTNSVTPPKLQPALFIGKKLPGNGIDQLTKNHAGLGGREWSPGLEADLRSALHLMPSGDRAIWINVLLVMVPHGETAWPLFNDWSRNMDDGGSYDEVEVRKKWDYESGRCNQNETGKVAVIFDWSKAYGWTGSRGESAAAASGDDIDRIGEGALVIQTPNGPRRVVVSEAAKITATAFQGLRAFNSAVQLFYSYDDGCWRSNTAEGDEDPEKVFYDAFDIGCSPVGFTPHYLQNALKIVVKRGLLPLPKADRNLIPFSNGLLNLKSGKLSLITPETAQTWILPHEYDPNAKCDFFKNWLLQVTEDTGCVELVRAFINACLKGRADLQTFLLLLGKGGSGKSTLLRVIEHLLGAANCHSSDMTNLENNRFELASVLGKKLVVIPDVESYKGKVSHLKSLTGQDPLRIERKNIQQTGSFIYDGMVIILSNENQLGSEDRTSGFARRRLVIRFDKHWTPAQKKAFNQNGGEPRLLGETSGIISWALGLSDGEVQDLVFNPPLVAAMATYQEAIQHNAVAAWINEELVYDHTAWTQIGVAEAPDVISGVTKNADIWLFPNFQRYCRRNNQKGGLLLSTNNFSQNVVEVLNTLMNKPMAIKQRRRGGNGITEVRLRKEGEEIYKWK